MPQSVKVGIFMTAALVVLAWLILAVEDWRLFGPPGTRVEAEFESVVGLDDKAAVRLAGVRVGRVDGIRLEGRRARVSLLLEQPVPLVEGTVASIANQGLLGDKFVEILPGPEGGAPLPADAVLPGRTPVSFDQAMEKIDEIGGSIQTALGSFTGAGGGGEGFSDLIASIQATADELRAVIAENRAQFGGTMRNFEKFSATLAEDLPRLTAQIEKVLGQVDAVVAENRDNLHGSMANIREVTDKIQTSVDNLNTITDKIARGEGTIGKLVNSDEAHDELMGALKSVESGVSALGDTLGRVNRVQLNLGLEGLWLSDLDDGRSAFRVDVLPRGPESRMYYRIDLVSDPRGRVYQKSTTETVTNPDGTTSITTTERLTRDERRSSWSGLFGLPFAGKRGTLWAGMIENTAGLEIDYGLVPEKLFVGFEAFDFGRERDLDPHLRISSTWHFRKNLYLRAGWDDPLVDEYSSPFFGAGFVWTDDDLKYLVGSAPSF